MGFFDFFRTKKADAKRDTSSDASGSMASTGDEKEVTEQSTESGWSDSSASDGGGGDGGGGGGD